MISRVLHDVDPHFVVSSLDNKVILQVHPQARQSVASYPLVDDSLFIIVIRISGIFF